MSRAQNVLLVVEPHDVTRELYVRELERTWRVLACADTSTAIRHLRNEAVDAVILEPFASGEDGWSLLLEMRRNPATAGIPIIICTVVDDRSRAMEMGVSGFLVKPVSPQQLGHEIAHLLSPGFALPSN